MKNDDFFFAIFEVLPVERLGLEDNIYEAMNILDESLNKYEITSLTKERSKYPKAYHIEDKERIKNILNENLKDISQKGIEDNYRQTEEMIWGLAIDYCDFLIIHLNLNNILFCLASNLKPEPIQQFSPNTIAQFVGTYTYPPTLPRLICSDALRKSGQDNFSKNLEVHSSYPIETAIAGDISFVDAPTHPLGGINLNYIGTDIEIRPLNLLDSKYLLTQDIVDVLNDESLLDKIEIAKVYPLQFTQADDLTREKMAWNVFNSVLISARYGTIFEILNEIMGMSLHLNWEWAQVNEKPLGEEQILIYAKKQIDRLQKVEEKEKSLRFALEKLQKKFPEKTKLIEWEINNLYSNIVNFSPIYLHFKAHLEEIVNKKENILHQYSNLVTKLNWSTLSENGFASIEDGNRIMNFLKEDPGIILIKIRTIIENIIKYIYRKKISEKSASLASMIYELGQIITIPPILIKSLHFLRLSGNLGAHEISDSIGSTKDIEAILPVFIRVVEWFLDYILES